MDAREWLLTKDERGNADTRIDGRHEGDAAWSTGNLVTPLIHGATYFPRLFEVIEATRAGDLVFFTDWQGDADERLTGEPGSEVVEVLGRADERGVDVRGLVWRSHFDGSGFFASENRHLGEQLQERGAEVLLDMRVRAGGSHHQKFLVVRHQDDPTRDVAFVGGMDLAHNRRDDADHLGDPQPQALTEEYGDHPPWHDVQVEIRGPAVHDVETVFRERWEDPTRLSNHPLRRVKDALRRNDVTPDALPDQWPAPPEAGDHTVQLLRTYPDLRLGRDYPFANGGERSVARGYSKALGKAERIVYVEDQYFWGHGVAEPFEATLRDNPELRVVVVIPLVPDIDGWNRVPQVLGRERALRRLMETAPGRVAAYGIENHARDSGLRPREGLRGRRHLGEHRVGQLQPALLDPRLRAQRGRARRGLRARPQAHPRRRAPRPPRRRRGAGTARRDGRLRRACRDVRRLRGRRHPPRGVAPRWPGGRATARPAPAAAVARPVAVHPGLGPAPVRDPARPRRPPAAPPWHHRLLRHAQDRPRGGTGAGRVGEARTSFKRPSREAEKEVGVPLHANPAMLVLEDGRTFRGESFGAEGETFGEAVFSTGMSGYQETLTDPSYHRQVVVMTAPHVGNTGMNDEDPESRQIWVAGYVVRDPARVPSNWRSQRSLDDALRGQGVVGISGVDTRALTRHLRERGAMRVGISTTESDPQALLGRVLASAPMEGAALAGEVTTAEAYVVPAVGEKRFTVAALDLGIKANTPRMMSERGIEVHVLPSGSTAEEILAVQPDGVFYSNGPGDPATAEHSVAVLREVLERGVPYFGICFGNQLFGRALGFGTYKLKYGHRGINQPVMDRTTNKVEVTAHNHGFAVDAPLDRPTTTPYGEVTVSHVCLNDDVVEGLELRVEGRLTAFSVQYHPEAAAGPHDAAYLFDRFVDLMSGLDKLDQRDGDA